MALGMKERNLKPLNSYMAFRAYYSKIFQPLQQKDISGFLTFLWQTDPSESKWVLLATSYTTLRANIGKELAPLDKFLAINGPYVGVIDPEKYLHTLGFEVHMIRGSFTIRRSPDFDWRVLHSFVLNSTISVWDILRNSVAQGYCSAQSINSGKLSKMVMTISAANDTIDTSIAAQMDRARLEDESYSNTQTFAAMPLGHLRASNPIGTTTQSELPTLGNNIHLNNKEVLPFDIQGGVVSAVPHEILETVVPPPTPVDSAFELACTSFSVDGDYTFNNDFAGNGGSLMFDPYMGSSFNCYDVGEWEWM